MSIDKLQIFRGEILHCLADPAEVGDNNSYEYFPDGLMIVQSGLIEAVGPAWSCYLRCRSMPLLKITLKV